MGSTPYAKQLSYPSFMQTVSLSAIRKQWVNQRYCWYIYIYLFYLELILWLVLWTVIVVRQDRKVFGCYKIKHIPKCQKRTSLGCFDCFLELIIYFSNFPLLTLRLILHYRPSPLCDSQSHVI